MGRLETSRSHPLWRIHQSIRPEDSSGKRVHRVHNCFPNTTKMPGFKQRVKTKFRLSIESRNHHSRIRITFSHLTPNVPRCSNPTWCISVSASGGRPGLCCPDWPPPAAMTRATCRQACHSSSDEVAGRILAWLHNELFHNNLYDTAWNFWLFCPQFHAVLKYRLIHLRSLSNQEPSLF